MQSFKNYIEYTKLRIRADKAYKAQYQAERDGNEEEFEKWAMIGKYWDIQCQKSEYGKPISISDAERKAAIQKAGKERDALEKEIKSKYDVDEEPEIEEEDYD